MTVDEGYMLKAIELAKKGMGKVNPNPMVGAVIVKDGKIIGQGYHRKFGEFHAERNAILECGEDMQGAQMYVTLEPCCHYGKTPPCTEIIISSGIKKVFVGCTDDNPIVENKGIDVLRKNGIEVIVGVLEKECRKLNEIFFHYIKYKTPFVIMKYAMTADGKIATRTGHSRWISGEASRRHAHYTRKRVSGIMVGIGTVLADDPLLNCRIEEGVDPIRIICDSSLKIPLESKIVQTAKEIPTIIATGNSANLEKKKLLQDKNIKILEFETERPDLKELMKILGKEGIDSVLIEGGGTFNYFAFQEGIVDKLHLYIAPKIFGGKDAKSPVMGLGVEKAGQAFNLETESFESIGEDIFIEYNVLR